MVGSNPQGVISTGGMIHTKETFGYGTYEFCARMGSTATSPLATGNSASGSHSALFNYINDSETEIDMEAYGSWPNHIDATTWKNPNPSQDVASADSSETYFQDPGMGAGFQVYKFVWTPNTITFYVNNQYQATLNNFIGSAPANLFVALFGSDSSTNSASLGVNQYMYVQWIRYTAPGDTPLPVPT
jgi:beta-glucanase (GH16 family)